MRAILLSLLFFPCCFLMMVGAHTIESSKSSSAAPMDIRGKSLPCQVSKRYQSGLAKLPQVTVKEPIVLAKDFLDFSLKLLTLIGEPLKRQDYTNMNTILHSLVDMGLGQLKSWLVHYQQTTGISSLGRNKILLAIVGWLASDSAALQQACLAHKDIAKVLNAQSFQALKDSLDRLLSLLSLSTTDQIVFFARMTKMHDARQYDTVDLVDTIFTFFGYPGAQFLYPLYLETAIEKGFLKLQSLRQDLEGPDCNDAYKAIRSWLRDATLSVGMEIQLPLTIPCDNETEHDASNLELLDASQ